MNYTVNGKLWIQGAKGIFLGEGRIELLKAIHDQGSISKASQEIGISYRKAWKLVKSMNESGPTPLVNQTSGGNKGGGTKLSDKGLEVIQVYDQLREEYESFLSQKSEEYNTLWK